MEASVSVRSPSALFNTAKNRQAADTSALSLECSDELLLSQIGGGSAEALAILFRRYARLVHSISNRILHHAAEADDVLQEVFLFIYRKGAIFESSKSSARSWIVQITYQRAIDRLRYLNARHFYTQLEMNDSLDSGPTESSAIDELQGTDGLVGAVKMGTLFESLTEDQRHALVWYFYEGYTFDEIALELKQSVRNVRNHYYRGLDKLRKQMLSRKLRGGNGCDRK